MNKRLVYLASPYSHEDPAVRVARFEAVNRCAAILMREGVLVFSPISHSHSIAMCGLRVDYEFWKRWNRAMIENCRAVLVCMLDGWDRSEGVSAEVAIARELGIPVGFLHTPDDPKYIRHFVRGAGLVSIEPTATEEQP